MRVYADSTGLDPSSLIPGEDLVLHLEESHGIDAADGVLAADHLTLEERARVDDLVVERLARWRETVDEPLTVHGVRLPWIWERDLIVYVLLPTVANALGLARAVDRYGPDSLTVMARDGVTELLAKAVADSRGIPAVLPESADSGEYLDPKLRGKPPLRRRLLAAALQVGVPTAVRQDSVLVLSYWPVLPLLDRLMTEPPRPAVWLRQRPAGPMRTLRAAVARGGWVGTPGPREQVRARIHVGRALRRMTATPLDFDGVDLGPCLHSQLMAMAQRRAVDDVATASLFRRVFRTRRIAKVLVPYDVEPRMRLITWLARQAGIPTLLVAHGAYPLRHTVVDMRVSDSVALWSTTFGPSEPRADRTLHVVGYPIPTEPQPARVRSGSSPPRVLVLGRGRETQTALFDDRYLMRHYSTAVEGIAATFPDAKILLRRAPAEGPEPTARLIERYPALDVALDTASDVMSAFGECDLCIGCPSTATFQAAIAGTPVIALNMSGYDWCWPLGGDTTVPIARSAQELSELLERWSREGSLPGRGDLLEALGVDGRDPIAELLKVVRG